MAITLGGQIQDPDSLSYELATYSATTTKELVIDNTNKLIKLTRVGNLTADGVTLKCLYSKLKELWKSDSTLIKYPFAMTPITDEQFEFINGWSLDTSVNSTTKLTVASCSGTASQYTITTSGNFNTSNVVPGLYVSGTNVGTNAKVVSVDSNTQITVDVQNAGAISAATLTFWGAVDYTYNLIRTGGWRLTSTAGATQELWMGAVSLGNLGAEQTTKTLTTTATMSTTSTVTVASTTGLQAGSYVTGAGFPLGTTIVSITDSTHFVISKTISSLASGAIITVRPKDQIYYQIGADSTVAPINAVLTGQVNQPIKIYGDASHGNFDFSTAGSVLKFFVREQAWTYGSQSKADIGVTTLSYQAYRFPVTNSADSLKITHADTAIDTAALATGIPNQSPYSNMSITWYASGQSRTIGGQARTFKVIIDADTTNGTYSSPGPATAEQIYEFVQWTLRRGSGIDIDQGTATKVGKTTRSLLQFVGDTLYTLYDSSEGGVYIDNFAAADTNRLVFADDTGTNRTYPYTSAGTLTFNSNLATDGANAIYRLFYKQINQTNTSKAFGTANAVLVKKADNSTDISGDLTGNATSKSFDYDYDGNTQCTWQASCTYAIGDEFRYNNGSTTTWYRVTTSYTASGTFGSSDTTNTTVIGGPTVELVAIGLTTAQYVVAEGSITKSISNSIGAVAALERNYANP